MAPSVPPHDQTWKGNERKQEMRRFIALPDIRVSATEVCLRRTVGHL